MLVEVRLARPSGRAFLCPDAHVRDKGIIRGEDEEIPLRKGHSISLPAALLKEARTVAKPEGKTPIELVRDVAKQYVAGSQFRGLPA